MRVLLLTFTKALLLCFLRVVKLFGRSHLEGLIALWKPVHRTLKSKYAMVVFLGALCDSSGSTS